MKKSFIVAGTLFTSFVVLTAFAQTGGAAGVTANASMAIGSVGGLINGFTQTVVKAIGGLFMAGAMVAFFYGIVEYIWGAREGKPDKIAAGNKFMTWGLVALFVMFSVYGIVKFGQGILFNGQDINTITIPDLNFKTGGPQTGVGGSTGGQQTGLGGGLGSQTGLGGSSQVVAARNAVAKSAYNQCTGSGKSAAQCQSVYQANGGTGTPNNPTSAGGVPDSACTYANFNGPCDGGNGTCKNSPIGGYECIPNSGSGGSASTGGPCDGIASERQRDICLQNQGGNSGSGGSPSNDTVTCSDGSTLSAADAWMCPSAPVNSETGTSFECPDGSIIDPRSETCP